MEMVGYFELASVFPFVLHFEQITSTDDHTEPSPFTL